ncbi:MAG: hypothetical protein ABIP55_16925, partial [Tepidisphaeraceae bacterium]
MRTSAKRLGLLTVAVSSALVAAGLVGCDDANSVDRRVRDNIQEARIASLAGKGDEADTMLKAAADEADAPNATKAHAKGLLAQAELDSALGKISDPENGIEATNRSIARLIWEIGQLGQKIGQTNGMVTAYGALEPAETRKQVQQHIQGATGGGDAAAWVGEGENAVPTLSAVKQDVAALQDQVGKQQQHIESLKTQQKDVAQAAVKSGQQAETLAGLPAVEQYKKASDLRKQSADLANQIEVAQAKLAPVQQDLKLAEARQAAVSKAIEQFQKLGQEIEKGWTAVEQQVKGQQQLATMILGPDEAKETDQWLTRKSANLAEAVKNVTELYTDAEQQLTESVSHFEQAASAAQQLQQDIQPRVREMPADNAMRKSLDALLQVYNPTVFKLGQANANLVLANLHASRAQTMIERQKVIAELDAVLKAAGLTAPAGLADANLAEQAKKAATDADAAYVEAFELYGAVADSSAPAPDKNGGLAGRIHALYGRALLARITGNANEKEHLAAAKSARDTVIQDSPGALAALPAELVVATTTRPVAPTTATAPAPTPASPTDAAAPAPTDTTAPAPADGTPPPAPAPA